MSKCQCFKHIEDVKAALESKEETQRLIHWLVGRDEDGPDADGRTCQCTDRKSTALKILNAIREACRPFLESDAVEAKQAVSPKKPLSQSSYAVDFPPLGGMTTPKKDPNNPLQKSSAKNDGRQKKRVRPQIVQSAVSLSNKPAKGNLVNVASSDEPLMPLRSTTTLDTRFAEEARVLSPISIRKQRSPSSAIALTPVEASRPCDERPDGLARQTSLVNMVDVYVAIVKNSLAPSILRELFLIISALNASESPSNHASSPTTAAFSSILRSKARCSFFGAKSLEKLSFIIKGIGSRLMQELVQCPTFQALLPELTEEYQTVLRQEATSHLHHESIPVNRTVLFSLPFDEQIDSRHNFKSAAEQAVYKNREETRDRFLYSLRSFLAVRGKGFEDALATKTRERVQVEARAMVDQLLDANVIWFCDFFCQLLLQIGLVPLEESDKELLNLTSQEKLFKLHQRFSDSKNQHTTHRKILRAEAKKTACTSTPEVEAQHFFPGHQAYFYLFIRVADSCRIGRALLGNLIDRVKGSHQQLLTTGPRHFTRILDETKMLARFVGLLVFSPSWGVGTSKATIDPLTQLQALGWPPDQILLHSAKNGSLVATVPWVTECLHMARWDDIARVSPRLHQALAVLIYLQRQAWRENTIMPGNKLYIVLCAERLLSELPVTPHRPMSFDQIALFDAENRSTGTVPDQIEHPDLFSDNRVIEELILFVSRHDRVNYSPLKSPGVSRKVRPSKISMPSDVRDSSRTGEDATSAEELTRKKLIEMFFHKHRDLKEACELFEKHSLACSTRDLVVEHIQQRLAEINGSDSSQLVMADEVQEACRADIWNAISSRAASALRVLLPTKDQQSIATAVSLLLQRNADSLNSKLTSIIASEMNNAQSASRQLFPSPQPVAANDVCAWSLAIQSLEHVSQHWSIFLDEKADMKALERSHSTALTATRDLSMNRKYVSSDEVLRTFFDSIMTIDFHLSDKILQWCLDDEVEAVDRWNILSLFLELTVRLRTLSRHGLPSLSKRLNSESLLSSILRLGLGVDESLEQIVVLVSALMQENMIDHSMLERTLVAIPLEPSPGRSESLADALTRWKSENCLIEPLCGGASLRIQSLDLGSD